MRPMVVHLLPCLLHSAGRGIALALCIALPLAGCIKSKGQLVSVEKASTPLPAGAYFTISNLSSGADFPTLNGPSRISIRGKTYVATPTKPDDDKPIRFHLIRV